jgi:hypothetical protein
MIRTPAATIELGQMATACGDYEKLLFAFAGSSSSVPLPRYRAF